ncbi:hypothetical protein I0C86_37040 [Plantactinospora sp. S1510]|uniref:Uncharacterized protein n=1 Tax=Plantactinospora alkalitolerans TaxID=2789879 RepID=A0ABS0H7R1_9ACTN|nr:hypothetical protein [Plantactinospora alkalitolerans]MBF9134497.1 hypothetical protein [Plantactinospora alkalitolerans]
MKDVRNDDEDMITMLRRLDDEPERPGRVDLARAVTEARRRRRTRRLTGASGAAVLAVAAVAAVPVSLQVIRPALSGDRTAAATAGPTATADPDATADPKVAATPTAGPTQTAPVPASTPPTRCTVHRLSIPGGDPMSLVTGADPTGRFVLGRSYPTGHRGTYPMLIWDNGKPRRVNLPGDDQNLTDVTTSGVAVGHGWTEKGPVPYIYRNGKVKKLPGATAGEALAINEANQIVGYREGERNQPVIWPGPSTAAVDLPLPGDGSWGEAVDIDEAGTVIGVLIDREGRHQFGYLWRPDGTAQRLPTPLVDGAPADSFRPQSIRNGWVTGIAIRGGSGNGGTGEEVSTAVRLHLPTGRFVEVPRSSFWPQNGNAQGWMVGFIGDRAGLLTDAGPLVLPPLHAHKSAPGNTGWMISDDGRTVTGQSEDAKGEPQAVVWRCR